MLLTHGQSAASSYVERHKLRAEFPDALERDREYGVWSQSGTDNQDQLLIFGKEKCWDVARDRRPILMTYPPTGELGYWCEEEGFYRFDDTLVAAFTSPQPPALFLTDGRILAIADAGFDESDRIVKMTTGNDPVITPLEYVEDLRFDQIMVARYIDGVPTLIAQPWYSPLAQFHVEGDTLVFDHTVPEPFPDDYTIEHFAMDDQGTLIVLGSCYEGGALDAPQTFVSRLDPAGAELLYLAPTDRSHWTLMELPESSGEIRIVRLVAPL